MLKIAVIVLADTETHADLGRIANALEVVKEFRQAGDTGTLIFDGAGTKWVGLLADPAHRLHAQFEAVRPGVAGACRYCAKAFGVRDQVERSGVPLLGDFEGHPSVHALVADGYQVVTF